VRRCLTSARLSRRLNYLLIECVDHAEADPGFAPTPDWALKIAEDFVRQIPADLPTHIVIANLAFHYVVGVFERHYNSTP
jgi:hypothetical protein